ncbi:ABC transporter permease [Paenibacillus cisolokensis]|uniref:ABC transporter permease n=1 Tax=Paenibacillus cisolokensis TaxID=1658519 RepID=A0ABQ4N803_9BACL|nr:ABC transporter permease [Paenibacillus cisolokensis]GIQ64295.1 ABC transporter permease [Paenibacillus cisolokensis]
MNVWKQRASALVQPLAAIAIGLAALAVAVALVGGSVAEAYIELWRGAFGNFYYFTNTLTRAIPILLIAVGLSLAFRAGFFNLGAEGQMVLGGISAALTALYLPAPGPVRLVAAIAAGMAAGGLWAAFAGWLNARFRINLLISTLLMNYIATYFAAYLVTVPFKDNTGSAALPQTEMIDPSAWLPKLFAGSSLHAGFWLAVAATVIVYVIMKHTVYGYQFNMIGSNPLFAAYGGIRRGPMLVAGLFISGCLAGLAGVSEVLGMQYRYLDGALTTPGYAWSGLMAALIAGSHPIGAALAAILLAALQTGAMGLERNTEVPLEVASVIQATVVLFVSAKLGIGWLKRRRKGRTTDGAAV